MLAVSVENYYIKCSDSEIELLQEIGAIVKKSQYLNYQAPIEFLISDFNEKKEANEEWNSSSFYTHNRGYKFVDDSVDCLYSRCKLQVFR